MTIIQELASWNPFLWGQKVDPAPQVGQKAPSTPKLKLPRADGKSTVITFLRHCGCPFAEKIFITLREDAKKNSNIHYVAISHSDDQSTRKWLEAVGGAGPVEVIVDFERAIYSAYGLGLSSFWHTLNPTTLGAVGTLEKTEKIGIRSTESGSRWQTAGMFAADAKGTIKYAHPAQSADDQGDAKEALAALNSG